jgi:Predicted Peptidoglycan domain.
MAANDCGHRLKVDGRLGHDSIEALNTCWPEDWARHMASRMSAYYRDLVRRKPRNQKFLPTWLKRAAWVG